MLAFIITIIITHPLTCGIRNLWKTQQIEINTNWKENDVKKVRLSTMIPCEITIKPKWVTVNLIYGQITSLVLELIIVSIFGP